MSGCADHQDRAASRSTTNGQRRARSVAATKHRNDGVAAVQWLLERTCNEVARTIEDPKLRATASMWAYKLQGCSDRVWLYRCPDDGNVKTVCSCCGLAMCPRRERRYVQQWVHRIRHLADHLRSPRGYSWKVLTVSLRQHGEVFERVNATMKMRAALARELRDEYGMLAGFGAVEEGEHEGENVHLHFLTLCRFTPRRQLQHWLQARDCKIRKCHHPADDRCESCKASHRGDCQHPEKMPDGRLRPRCKGSWYVDVRRCYSRQNDGRLVYDAGVDAAAEVVKYACKPTMHGNPHDANDGELRAEIEHAKRTVMFHLAMRGRHRVETYGEAKKVAPDEENACDDVEPNDKGPKCSACGGAMVSIAFGTRFNTCYRWHESESASYGPAG